MTKLKLCGLSRPCDINYANELKPEYIGFVFAPGSRRFVSPETAAKLKKDLSPEILAVGVFVNETVELVADLLAENVIDLAQLHGNEDEDYLAALRALTDKPIIQAFRPVCAQDMILAEHSNADFILFDSGAGTGKAFDWTLLQHIHRPYFLAGGLDAANAGEAVRKLHPFAVDVSSGIETDGVKDKTKMAAFTAAVRKEDKL